MAPSVFHPFARLPVELRLQIWEAACVKSPASYRGLQYIDVWNEEAVPIPCDWPKSPGHFITTNFNRSAYLIDGGLWRACKESREIIAKYTQFEDWVGIQRKAIIDSKSFYKYNADSSDGNKSHHPAIIGASEGEEECCMLVYPANDIFCIQVDDWADLKEQGSDPEIYMSFIRCKRDDRKDYHADEHEDDAGWQRPQKLQLENIGLEFDNSWLVDLPDHVYDLAYENSARGYLTNLLKQKADYLDPLDFEREAIWIVDKWAKWFSNADEHHGTVYRDCDGEYIEVYCDDLVNPYSDDEKAPNAAGFLRKLVRLGFDDFYYQPESPGGWFGPWGPEPEKIVRLLVRRDNEVKEVTGKCKNKCFRIGWCICSNDEGNWWEDEDEDVELPENEA
ncbi:tetracycline resistance protein [Fusarium heterosporum]|uniref:Tetracycline resistance protein n=1 Tax=Fusarium heterosporum TaxID=42747 RepID=A0A8H5T5U2_FUSHE|nr:tetracycline resistance protein [Fusarium heterosporum]